MLIQQFLQPGVIGFYQSATITCIALHDKSTRQYHNIFTLVTLNETPCHKQNVIRHGSSKTFSLNKRTSVMLTFQDVDVPTVIQLYSSVANSGQWCQPGCPNLVLDNLSELGPVFLSKDSRPIGLALRNSFLRCHYIMEFFAKTKQLYRNLTKNEMTKLTDWILIQVPIDLNTVSDRIGNIIFQLPITILEVQEKGNGNNGLNIPIAWHPKLSSNPPAVDVRAYCTFDKAVIGNGVSSNSHGSHTVNLTSNRGLVTTRITRKSDDLLLFQSEGHFLESFQIGLRLSHPIKRNVNVPTIRTGDPEISYTVDLYSNHNQNANSTVDWRQWVGQRQHKESVTELESKKFFVQYAKGGNNEHQKALSDIRFLISTYGDAGVSLWDPYCTARDILATVFACQRRDAPLRVITSNLAIPKGTSWAKWTSDFQDTISKSGNLEGIDLRVRVQTGTNGWAFHDRFLMFPSSPPHVWSLGASLNHIGALHSILLKVEHAQPVIDAFDGLWDKLGGNEI